MPQKENNKAQRDDEVKRPAGEEEYAVDDILDPEDESPEEAAAAGEEVDPELTETEMLMKQLNSVQEQLEKEKKEYMFLMADFDNFRKRTLKEKSEIIKNGAESAMKGLLPIVDDFERGLAAIKESSDAEAVKEGMTLIYNKLVKYLEQNGVKAMDTDGAEFNPDLHEAIAMVPTDDESQKGKVVDTVSRGYTMNDKVIRHAKVAVAQ